MKADLQPILDKLDRMIFLLEKMAGEKISVDPVFPPFPDYAPSDHGAVLDHCSKCGLPMYGTMGYACQQVNCPTGMGPTT